MKKIINALIISVTVILQAMALPASAQNRPAPGEGPSGLVFNKKVTEIADKTYSIEIEAFVTGTTKSSIADIPVPVDIVLVLDNSSSMNESISTSSIIPHTKGYSYNDIKGKEYKVLYNGEYYTVVASDGLKQYYLYYDYNGRHYLSGRSTSNTKPGNYLAPDETIWTGKLYYRAGSRWAQTASTGFSYQSISNGSYYYSNSYHQVYAGADIIANGCILYFIDSNGERHYLSGTEMYDSVTFSNPTDKNSTIWTGTLYEINSISERKIDILKTAVNSFIDSIAEKAKGTDKSWDGGDDIAHRIGIVTFNGSANLEESLEYINSGTNVQYLHNVVNAISLGSGTCPDLGLNIAHDQFTSNSIGKDELRSRVVVMFTDGEPYPGSKRNDIPAGMTQEQQRQWVADNAINTSHTLINTDKATVYSIGIFDKSVADWCYNYMHYVTSEYPAATSLSSPGQRVGTKEYMQTSDGSNLSDIFTSIAEETISGQATIPLNAESTTVVDVISDSFKLPDGAGTKDIGLFVAKCTGSDYPGNNGNVTFSFGEARPANETHPDIAVSISGKTISVTGYDFEDNYVSNIFDRNNVPTGEYRGEKLIMRFIVVLDPDSPGGAFVATNGSESGVYYEGKQIAAFQIPHVKIPNIVIIKRGLHKGESAVFSISRINTDKGKETSDYTMMAVATCTEEGKPAITRIKIQSPGRYKVTENGWSWAYDLTSLVSSYDKEDSASISAEQWEAVGYNNIDIKVPTIFGTETNLTGMSIIRNVNDFTEDKGYNGTLYIFENKDRDGAPAHAEDLSTNIFYETAKK